MMFTRKIWVLGGCAAAGALIVACSNSNFASSGSPKKKAEPKKTEELEPGPDEDTGTEKGEDETTVDTSTAAEGTLAEDGEVSKECTVNLAYDPASIQCSISVTDHSNVWWGDGFAPYFWFQPQQDATANWISPLARQDNLCPSTSSETLIYVSWFNVSTDGTYNVTISNDEGSGFRLWKSGNPKKETIVPQQGPVDLKKGRYSLIIEGNDTGVASAMAATVRNPSGATILVSNPSANWCIFRTPRGTDISTYVPAAAGCRPCFGTSTAQP